MTFQALNEEELRDCLANERDRVSSYKSVLYYSGKDAAAIHMRLKRSLEDADAREGRLQESLRREETLRQAAATAAQERKLLGAGAAHPAADGGQECPVQASLTHASLYSTLQNHHTVVSLYLTYFCGFGKCVLQVAVGHGPPCIMISYTCMPDPVLRPCSHCTRSQPVQWLCLHLVSFISFLHV